MTFKKLYIILLYFLVGNAFCLSNFELNNAIKEYLHKHGKAKNFSINKKIKLPECKKKYRD